MVKEEHEDVYVSKIMNELHEIYCLKEDDFIIHTVDDNKNYKFRIFKTSKKKNTSDLITTITKYNPYKEDYQ